MNSIFDGNLIKNELVLLQKNNSDKKPTILLQRIVLNPKGFGTKNPLKRTTKSIHKSKTFK